MISAVGALVFLAATQIEVPAFQPVPAIPPYPAVYVPQPSCLPETLSIPEPGLGETRSDSDATVIIKIYPDGTMAGVTKARRTKNRVEVQVFSEDMAVDADTVVPENKPNSWMEDLGQRMANTMRSRHHPYSSITGIKKLVIVRVVSEEEANTTEPVEQRAERAISNILSG